MEDKFDFVPTIGEICPTWAIEEEDSEVKDIDIDLDELTIINI